MTWARIFFIILLVGIIFIRWQRLPTDDFVISIFANATTTQIVGVVQDEPDKKKNHINVLVHVEQLSTASSSPRTATDQSKLLISVPLFTDVFYGDRIQVTGIIKKPEKIISDDGSEFDYPSYLAKDFIFYVMEGRSVEVAAHDQASHIKKYLLDIKKGILQNIADALPTPHSFLAGGLIIAGKGSLNDELQEQFKRAGLIHIVVLSGFNITIVGQFIIALCSFLPSALRNIFGGLGIIAFSVMAGSSATVIRSVVMSLIALFARATNNTYNVTRALFIAGAGMVVQNPRILIYDPSFQLSFMATLGLILLGTPMQKLFAWVPETLGLREIVSSTFATQVFVTPLILHLSGMISFVSLFVNILVLPLIPPTMLVVCISGVISFISSGFAIPFAFVSYLLLSYELKIVGTFSSLSFAAMTLSKISWQTTFSVYALYSLIFLVTYIYKRLSQLPAVLPSSFFITKTPPG